MAIQLTDGQRAFFSRMTQAVTTARAKGAVFNAVAMTAQAALESGWGSSLLAQEAMNLFGVKATPAQIAAGQVLAMPTREWTGTAWIRETDYWTRYPSWNECIVAYAELIEALPWFRGAVPHADPPHGDGDALAWLNALEVRGRADNWATDPNYVSSVSALFGAVRQGLGA